MHINTKAQGLVKVSSAPCGPNQLYPVFCFLLFLAMSFLPKSIYISNFNWILENPDHAKLILIFLITLINLQKVYFLLSFSN